MNYPSHKQTQWATTLGCKLSRWPLTYLGVPLGMPSNNIAIWDKVIQKFHNNLNNWAASHLNMAGKLVLLKATLDSLPSYQFNFLVMPKGVEHKIDSISGKFLYGNHKLRLTNQSTLLLNKQSGGLGITNLTNRNLAMLGKIWWRIKENKNNNWLRLLKSKYGQNTNMWTTAQNRNNKSLLMRNLTFILEYHEIANYLNHSQFKWQANEGNRIYFCEDIWIKDVSLATAFPRLYRLSKNKFVFISDFLNTWSENITVLQHLWYRTLRQQEQEDATLINDILQSYTVSETDDHLIWKVNDKAYNTATMYNRLNSTNNNNDYRWAFIWTLKIPPKIRTFLWKISRNILPTKQFLANRLRDLNLSSICTLCNNAVENIYHMFV